MYRRRALWAVGVLFLGVWLYQPRTARRAAVLKKVAPKVMSKVVKSEEEWRKVLTPEQYRVLRLKGTEAPFTGLYWNNREAGTYYCAACGQELFTSATKFDAGCGWPSFWEAVDPSKVEFREDRSFGTIRTEVLCSRCGGHLGHVFDDGPEPTGKRYCINSASLRFEKKAK